MKKVLRVFGCIFLALLLLVGGYFAYVMIAYYRIGDMPLEVCHVNDAPATNTEYTLFSWNIGFGAYEDDYGFFMDGGTESWAWSPERLDANLAAIGARVGEQNADFYIFQEVDFDSTRSYHRDEREIFYSTLAGYAHSFCQNYDSPFLCYPLTQPHGASRSGLLTFSRFNIASAQRRELPIENSLMKLLDLDRCYSIQRIPLQNGKDLVLYNFHLSAYTSDGTIATEQLNLLLREMQTEYEKGNYCIAGGDFNKDLLGNSGQYFGKSDIEYTWAQPIPDALFNGYNIQRIAPFSEQQPVPSCRNADSAYHKGQYVLTVDGFLVSDNVTVIASDVIDYSFRYSDHNPVFLKFILNEEA